LPLFRINWWLENALDTVLQFVKERQVDLPSFFPFYFYCILFSISSIRTWRSLQYGRKCWNSVSAILRDTEKTFIEVEGREDVVSPARHENDH